jgi:hypothetical protein
MENQSTIPKSELPSEASQPQMLPDISCTSKLNEIPDLIPTSAIDEDSKSNDQHLKMRVSFSV